MKIDVIVAAAKKSNGLSFEAHLDDGISLMMYPRDANNGLGVEIDRRRPGETKHIYYEWLSQLIKIWNERKISITGTYDYHDSINPYDLKTGKRCDSSNRTISRRYLICDETLILTGGKRFSSEESMDSFVMDSHSELKRKVKRLEKLAVNDTQSYIYGNISTGSIDECIIGWTNLVNHDVKRLLKTKK